MASVRCFVAVWPSAEVVEKLAQLPRPALEGVHWSQAHQWHVTLRFFGELEPAEVATAASALADAVTSLARAPGRGGPLVARGGPATGLLGPGLLVWPVAGLEHLAGTVERATAALGQAPPRRPFSGHVTLARSRRGTDLRRGHLSAGLTSDWEVGSVCLVESRLHPGGARYNNLVDVPL